MDLIKILGGLIVSGALSRGSGGDVLGSILSGALGGSQNRQTHGGGTMGDLLGSILGGGDTLDNNGGLGDILGSLIGGSASSSKSGRLGDILDSLARGNETNRQSAESIPSSVSELEDLLGVGGDNNRGLGGGGGLGGLLAGALGKHVQHNSPNHSTPSSDDYSVLPIETDVQDAVDHAALIIRAMINAAKSDGSIDQNEQEKVLEKLGDITQEEIDFIKKEFASPLDIEAFAHSIPKGMEQQIYMISLMAIDLDKNAEANYLAQLAQALNIPTDAANHIHDKLGVPKIFA